jgi:hypothetical protein
LSNTRDRYSRTAGSINGIHVFDAVLSATREDGVASDGRLLRMESGFVTGNSQRGHARLTQRKQNFGVIESQHVGFDRVNLGIRTKIGISRGILLFFLNMLAINNLLG